MLKKKRIFIKNLSERVTSNEIESTFANYGSVINVDIKEHKNFDPTLHQARNFAYINLDIDDSNLQKCFKDFQNNEWHGQYVELQVAKESFLEQLKREREESTKTEKPNTTIHNELHNHENISKKPLFIKDKIKTNNNGFKNDTKLKITKFHEKPATGSIEDDKSVKVTSHVNNVIKKQKESAVLTSEIKRAHSVNQKIQKYRQQKIILQEALSNVDKKSNKIKFTDNDELFSKEDTKQNEEKKVLFESDEESDHDFNFEVKKTFTGKEGKKLYELQSKYKNDKRFVLDDRFIENENMEDEFDNSETIEDEKQKEFEILEQILGSKAKPKKTCNEPENSKRGMLRFDPTQSDHLKYEIKKTESCSNKVKRKREVTKKDTEKDEEIPTVSKEVFYKVSDDLKNTFQKEQPFSLLHSFGNPEEDIEQREEEEEQPKQITKKTKFSADINPFQYDSSNDEDEEEELQKYELENDGTKDERIQKKNATKFWSEPFFFKEDDYRFQEGVDFVKRVASEENNEFDQLRRDLKNIVKAKVKNNQRKNKPFKKKLGGNKKKKMIRMKKAMNG